MQFKTFAATLAMAGAVSAQASTITATYTPNASQASVISTDVSNYIAGSQYQSLQSIINSYTSSLAANNQAAPTTLTIPSWFGAYGPVYTFVNSLAVQTSVPSGVPTAVASAYVSMAQAAVSIINKDTASAAAGSGLDRTVMMTGLVVAGTAAFALLL